MNGFTKLTLDQLHPMAVVAQSLDNQWVPPGLLRTMLARGLELGQVRERLRAGIRAEYIRALVNSPQVIINRAFLYNNPIVFESFAPGSPDRDAFLKLLSTGAIVQLLVAEHTPWDEPAFLEHRQIARYTVLKEGWKAWSSAAKESHVHSLRFSWENDQANTDRTRQRLAAAFTRRAQTLVNLYGPSLALHLGTDLDTALQVKRRLADVARRCADYAAEDRSITREQVYQEFVTADDSDPALGRYDPAKPFCAEVKQLVDLAYSVNLASGVETLALTPGDALHRTALQELEHVKRQGTPLSAVQLSELLRGAVFDLVQETFFIDTFAKLSMQDVWDVRQSAAWDAYVQRMNALLADPLSAFADPAAGASAVVRAYLELLAETTRIATRRNRPGRPGHSAREFAVVMGVEIAGATLEYQVLPGGHTAIALAGAVAAPLVSEAAKVTVRLGLRAHAARREQRRLAGALDTRIQVINGWVESAGRFWDELVAEMHDIPGMTEADRLLREKAAAVEGDRDQEAEDPLA